MDMCGGKRILKMGLPANRNVRPKRRFVDVARADIREVDVTVEDADARRDRNG